MSEPVERNCSGCGGSQPFEQIHTGDCPDTDGGECPEWACTGCGAAIIVETAGTVIVSGYQPVRAA